MKNTLSQTLAAGQVAKNLGRLSGLSRPSYLAGLILATLLLAACGGGGSSSSSGGGGGPQVYQVSGATVVGGFRNVTINWLNPAVGAGNVTAVNITYQIVSVNGESNDKTTLLLNDNRHLLSDGTTVITETLVQVEPARYTFTIEPVLGGVLINATTRAVAFPNVNVIVNPDDLDGDGVLNSMDVDADGDGLIEIYNATQLNMMRNNLNGTGLDSDNSDMVFDAGGNSMGCSDGRTLTACNGYEQMADIDLTAAGYADWEPVGTCGGAACDSGSGSQFFSGTFSGNNFTISNLFINVATRSFGIGFFGAISPDVELRNVHIRGDNITADTSDYVGGLFGFGSDATISNSSVTLNAIGGTQGVGGLVGAGTSVMISSSVATVGSISGTDNVGGLLGFGQRAAISSSVATVGSISGTNSVGGLAGDGVNAAISSSVATVGSISGESSIGGLVGQGFSVTISSSVATVGNISGVGFIGGLVGNGDSATISSSVAITNSLNAGSFLGGLISGPGIPPAPTVTASYWDAKVIFANLADNTEGVAKSTAVLTTPMGFTGPDNIYATWANAWCNPATGEFTTDSSSALAIDANRVWDLGTGAQYPAITCVNNFFSLADQRAAAARVVAGESPIQ